MTKKTITDRTVDPDILAYTVGEDTVLDLALAKWDCMGTAAHVTMLSEMKGLRRPVVTKAEAAKVRRELGRIAALAEKGAFKIRVEDQDVHMAVERMLTEKLGDLGKKIHTGRSRNDQVAVDVRLHMKDAILHTEAETVALAWHAEGITTVEMARAHSKIKTNPSFNGSEVSQRPKAAAKNAFLNFDQHNYDMKELARKAKSKGKANGSD